MTWEAWTIWAGVVLLYAGFAALWMQRSAGVALQAGAGAAFIVGGSFRQEWPLVTIGALGIIHGALWLRT